MEENSIIAEGKTSTEAIEKGLKELHCSKNDVEIKILEDENKKIFFSILEPRKVRVKLTLKHSKTEDSPEKKEEKKVSKEVIERSHKQIEEFLDKFCKLFNDLQYKITENENSINVELSGEDSKNLIGYRGNVINSLQTILNSVGERGLEERVRVYLDINNYRAKREKTLIELSHNLEKKVIRTGKKEVLEPMTAYERKIMHEALQNSTKVTTYSIGDEPHRKLVIDKKQN